MKGSDAGRLLAGLSACFLFIPPLPNAMCKNPKTFGILEMYPSEFESITHFFPRQFLFLIVTNQRKRPVKTV